MQAIAVRDRDAGLAGLSLTNSPYPHAAENDVIVRVHAAGFTRGELARAGTWTDRGGRDRTPSVPGHELSGVVAELPRVSARSLSAAHGARRDWR
jgi:D-arabinose 1-dehydrogenase-like Zn-dependent alcohol dehydrogenase